MGLTFESLKGMLEQLEVSFWTHPDRPSVMFGMGSTSGKRFVITASIDGDGSFFQVRSVEYAHCPANHKHYTPVARLLLALNYHYRAVKFAVDPNDGEIVAYGDLILLDGSATSAQVMGLLSFFLNVLDEAHDRLLATLVNGIDPGLPPPVEDGLLDEEAPAEPDDVV